MPETILISIGVCLLLFIESKHWHGASFCDYTAPFSIMQRKIPAGQNVSKQQEYHRCL
jgi:hypothetical protein